MDPALIRSMIATESGFNQNAVSPKGAQGLMQLMPYTAYRLGVSDPFDPEENILGGIKYMRYLLDTFAESPDSLKLKLGCIQCRREFGSASWTDSRNQGNA